jgi:hypothetical protein
MTFVASLCLQIVLAEGLLGSSTRPLDPQVLLEGYNRCNSKFETISHGIETTLQVGPKKYVYSLKHCSDHEKKQWIGRLTCYNEDGTVDQASSTLLVHVFDAEKAVIIQFYNPELKSNRPPRASLFGGSKRNAALQGYCETPSHGGAVAGRLFGSNGRSVYDLLKETPNPQLHDEATKMMGYDTYLVEANTLYGTVKAWIAPDLDYNCLRWQLVKGPQQFHRDGSFVNDGFTKLTAVLEAKRVERIDGHYIVTQGQFDYRVENGDTLLSHSTYRYSLTNVDLTPDYEALGAFAIQLPEGTVVVDEDKPGIRYRWTGGQLVAELTQAAERGPTEKVAAPAVTPESSKADDEPDVSPVDKSNLIRHVEALAALESRHVSHPGNKKAEEYILAELKKCGYSPICDAFQAQDRTLQNVITNRSDKTRSVVLLSAHFDSTASVDRTLSSQAPGADDNASGVAALLELARILKDHPIQMNVELVFFNCEEMGTAGSRHLADQYRDNQWPIDCVINVDTIGTWNGPLSETCPVNYVTDENSLEIIQRLQERFPYPLRKARTMWRDDHASFWRTGVKAIEITEEGCTPHMHKPTDTPEKLHYDNIARIVHGLYVALGRWGD